MNSARAGRQEDREYRDSLSGPAVVRIILGGQLRQLREASGLTPEEAAWRIRASRSKISRLENGRIGFKQRDVSDLLELYGVTDPAVTTRMLELVDQASERGWWVEYADIVPGWLEPYLGLEASATLIRSFDLQFAHGLLQTEDYARAVTRTGLRHAQPSEISRRVAIRIKRQELLDRPNPPRIWSIIDEAVLRRPAGGRAVMRGQLRHLAGLTQRRNITIQVVPFTAGLHDGAGGAFTILRFAQPEVADVVYAEQLTGAQYLARPADSEHYLDVANRLSATALSPDRSLAFIESIADDL